MGNGIRVLVADDEPHIRALLVQIVRALGGEVVAQAGDGVQAVEAFQQSRPDMVILDLHMPRMDGQAALERILALDPWALVLVLTAEDTIDTVRACLDRGARGYILKSNGAEEIHRLISEAWGGYVAEVRAREAAA